MNDAIESCASPSAAIRWAFKQNWRSMIAGAFFPFDWLNHSIAAVEERGEYRLFIFLTQIFVQYHIFQRANFAIKRKKRNEPDSIFPRHSMLMEANKCFFFFLQHFLTIIHIVTKFFAQFLRSSAAGTRRTYAMEKKTNTKNRM